MTAAKVLRLHDIDECRRNVLAYGFGDFVPTFPDGFHCSHGYPPGECCPACGEIPDPVAGMVLNEHAPDCQCFSCEEDE